MSTTELIDENGNPINHRVISGEDEPLLESLHEKLFDFSKDELKEIRRILESSAKSQLAIENPETFNTFIEQLKALIRKYHALKSSFSDVKSDSEITEMLKDGIKHLTYSEKILDKMNRNVQLYYSLNPPSPIEFHTDPNYKEDPNKPNVHTSTLHRDIAILLSRLQILSTGIENGIKTGRPPVNDMRSWLIREVAKLYLSPLGLEPSKTRDGVFNELVNFLLKFVGDPLQDSFSAIRKAFQSK